LGVTRRVQSLDFDVPANGESFAMARSRGDILAVFATDDRKRIALEDLGVAASMVVVASCR
jgi:hypothetical protein